MKYPSPQYKQSYLHNHKLYEETVKAFSNSVFISTASIQRIMKVSYARSSATLDKLIKSGFASSRIGAYPCKVLEWNSTH